MFFLRLAFFSLSVALAAQNSPGKQVAVGGIRLHIRCTGAGSPTVVIESGFDEFSSDWALVQGGVERFTRVCIYDRAGYGESAPSPLPRTFSQINLELHEALKNAGEHAPYVLLGHSYGGNVARSYAERYPEQVAALMLVEAVPEHQPIMIGGRPTLIKDFAQGKDIPSPQVPEQSAPVIGEPSPEEDLPGVYEALPPALRAIHKSYQRSPALQQAENGEREWSSEELARWDKQGMAKILGAKPVLVITRALENSGGSTDQPDIEARRLRAQAEQMQLSSDSLMIILPVGHDMQLEAPDSVTAATELVVRSVREHRRLRMLK
jgi:pimeloyl-ACP methyl ester carboxylesterase